MKRLMFISVGLLDIHTAQEEWVDNKFLEKGEQLVGMGGGGAWVTPHRELVMSLSDPPQRVGGGDPG